MQTCYTLGQMSVGFQADAETRLSAKPLWLLGKAVVMWVLLDDYMICSVVLFNVPPQPCSSLFPYVFLKEVAFQ